MARTYPLHPAERPTLKSALKHTKKKARAAVNTNRHLELTQGIAEAQNLEGYCEETLQVVEQATGSTIEFTGLQVVHARSALRIYGGTLDKKQTELGELMDLADSNIAEIADEIAKVAKLLRVLSPQTDVFTEPASAHRPEPEPTDDAPSTPPPQRLLGAGDPNAVASADYEIEESDADDLEATDEADDAAAVGT